ncbi:MAG: chemotaxis protein CheX [Planctomycetaceae bacterium]|nr:chemotaxis protein CheX [Planctomycetaceae bacterium]
MDIQTRVMPAGLERGECVPQAAVDILMMTCGLQPREDDVLDETILHDAALMAVISLVGDVGWSVFIGIPQGTAEPLVQKFAGFEVPFDSPDMCDAIGELCNIFAGDIKAKLDAQGVRAEISLPSVTRGEKLSMLFPKHSPVHRSTFSTDLGKLLIGVGAKSAA